MQLASGSLGVGSDMQTGTLLVKTCFRSARSILVHTLMLTADVCTPSLAAANRPHSKSLACVLPPASIARVQQPEDCSMQHHSMSLYCVPVAQERAPYLLSACCACANMVGGVRRRSGSLVVASQRRPRHYHPG